MMPKRLKQKNKAVGVALKFRQTTSAPAVPVKAALTAPQPNCNWIVGLTLFALAVGVFFPILKNDFINLDDTIYVYENPQVQAGLTLKSLQWACTTSEGGLWHPLTWISLMFDRQVFGPTAAGFHFTAMLLHGMNTALLFRMLQLATGAKWRSALVAALFAVHPLHVESVAWIAERKDVLSTLFGMLTLCAYVHYAKAPENKRAKLYFGLALIFLGCGLMAKATLVTWPLLFLLIDYWPLHRLSAQAGPRSETANRLLCEKIPFLLAGLIFSLAAWQTQRTAGAVAGVGELTVTHRLGNASVSYFRYLLKTIWPANLSIYYPFPKTIEWISPLVSAATLILVSLIALKQLRQRPWLLMGWGWYVVTLLPVIGLVQIGAQSHADRYTYIPLIGIFVLMIWGGNELIELSKIKPIFSGSFSIATIIGLSIVTRHQIGVWKNSETVFSHALAVTKSNGLAHNNLAGEFIKQGRIDEAIHQLQKAVEFMPAYAEAHNNLGVLLGSQGQLDKAVVTLRTATKLNPNYYEAQFNLGHALTLTGQTDAAVQVYEIALKLKPADADSHQKLAALLGAKGNLQGAVQHFKAAVQSNPHLVSARCGLGVALIQMNRLDEAVDELTTALNLTPDSAEVHCNLGIALAKKGQIQAGIFHLQRATELSPSYLEAQSNLNILKNQPNSPSN